MGKDGCYGNNHLISESGQPIKTMNNGVYIADNGASFGDVIIRTLFGVDPPWLATDAQHVELYLQSVSRGDFSGTLRNVNLFGSSQVDIVAGASGVSLSRGGLPPREEIF